MEERFADALAAGGKEAFDRGEAGASRLAFEEALAEGESATLLEGLARALYLEVRYADSIAAHERAFAAYQEEGDPLGAARAARILAWLYPRSTVSVAVIRPGWAVK